MLTYRQSGRTTDQKTTLTYGDTETEQKKRLVHTVTSPLGVMSAFAYNKGQQTSAETSAGGLLMKTGTAYDAKTNYVTEKTDARGEVVHQAFDPNKGTLTSVTDPAGQTVNYAYDAVKRVTKTQADIGDGSYINQYTYAQDKLTAVSHNTGVDGEGNAADNVTYAFAYDTLNRPTTVSVGNQPLSTTSYTDKALTDAVTYDTFGNLASFTEKVGAERTAHTTQYTYDAENKPTEVAFDPQDTTSNS